MVQFVRQKLEISPEGVKQRRLLLRPSTEAIWTYHLRQDIDIDQNGLIVRTYPEHMIVPLDEDPNHTRLFIKTDLNGRPTKASFETEALNQHIETLESLNASYKAAIARTQEEMNLISSNVTASVKRNIELIKIAREAAVQLTRRDDLPEYEQYGDEEYSEGGG